MKRYATPINDMYAQGRYRGMGKGEHGPVKVLFSRDKHPVVDPPTKLGMRAGELRLEAPKCELLLREALESFKARGVEFQHSVPMHGFIADFYCPDHNLIVELDGPHHKHRQKYDRRRDEVFRKHGIRTLRYPSAWVYHCIDRILTDLAHQLNLL